MTAGELGKMPKIELHCHLDGSLGRAFLEKRLGREVSPQELSVPDDCASLAEYLEKFALPCSCLMDEEGLEGAGPGTRAQGVWHGIQCHCLCNAPPYAGTEL